MLQLSINGRKKENARLTRARAKRTEEKVKPWKINEKKEHARYSEETLLQMQRIYLIQ